MSNAYKPAQYNSLAPYLIVDDASKLVDFMVAVFGATVLRQFDHPDGIIQHIELLLDDSVLMMSNSTKQYPAHSTMLHLYVSDVFETFNKALEQGATPIEAPIHKEGDPDIRGSFYDIAGNYWAVGTQLK